MPTLTRSQVETMNGASKNFNDQDLSGCDLSGLKFSSREFKRANLRGANLQGATFEYCEFKKSDLSKAVLSGAKFETCQFPGALLDAATAEGTQFRYCDFKGASWSGTVVKKCEFDSCDDIVGLPPHKVYASLSDMPDEKAKLAVCTERYAQLAPLLKGSVRQREDDTSCAYVGEFRGRPFRISVDYYDGCPEVQLLINNTLDQLSLCRDPKLKLKQQQRDQWDEVDDTEIVHFLSDSVYLEETREELEKCLRVISLIAPQTLQNLLETMETLKINALDFTDKFIEADYKKDILVTDLSQGVPLLLELFSQIAPVLETGRSQDSPGPATEGAPMFPAPVTPTAQTAPAFPGFATAAPVAVPQTPSGAPSFGLPESPSFDLSKHCRHCGTAIPWGQFECPSCGKSF